MPDDDTPNPSALTPVRIGVVGAGPWATVHAGHIARHPDVELAGVWARRPEAAAEVVAAAGGTVYASVAELLDDVDAVDLCVPPDVQPALAIEAARAGKALMLEKPIAATLSEAEALAAACRESGVVTQVMLTRRFHPVTRAFLETARRELPPDRVDGVVATFLHGAFLGGPMATPWRLREGVLLDLGPHLLDLVEQVAGPIESVTAATSPGHTLAVTAHHREGAVSQLTMSGHTGGRSDHRVLAFGETTKLAFDAADVDEATCFATALTELVAAIRTGSPVVADAERGLELQRLLDLVHMALGQTTARQKTPRQTTPSQTALG
ncbi:Gfo/Idh/MocA family oxidoreductase [Arsenicicoccus piscis]|uniref:Gfo/Idh/MocA family oxidoreductase n=1 Tax=Arsenicicoccus piscis TaxID=673954 RepID=A0ABQ6HK92_9MICO|nr:Gfo/Idh/MocA family oxidoreductase [Arsenicicoccus piscis]MCH8627158.1 Gfo/Idh/MocA family oxidoreductase [Arsenicicoccus piscis]GMA18881.1 hypothetical protein GCM10025862_09020 [Arsenicicoccus piscis]